MQDYTLPVHAVKKKPRPVFPFWKDERVGLVTTAGLFRLFIVSVVVGFLIMGVVGFVLIDVYTQLQDTIKTGRQSRIDDQKRTDLKLQNLVCVVIKNTPPGRSIIVDQFAKQYPMCPKYVYPGKPAIAKPTPSSTETFQVPSHPFVSPSASPASPAPTPTGTPQPSVTHGRPPTAHPTGKPSHTPIVDLTSVTCQLAGIFC